MDWNKRKYSYENYIQIWLNNLICMLWKFSRDFYQIDFVMFVFSCPNPTLIGYYKSQHSIVCNTIGKMWFSQLLFKIEGWCSFVNLPFPQEHPVYNLLGRSFCCSSYKRNKYIFVKFSWFVNSSYPCFSFSPGI